MQKVIPEYTGSDLCRMQAHEVVALLRKGAVSPAELLAASRERVEATDQAINAMPTTCWDRAAAAIDDLPDGEQDNFGWLGGLPRAQNPPAPWSPMWCAPRRQHSDP